MLIYRLILGPIFIFSLAALCWLDFHAARPGIYLLPLAIVLSLLGAGELLAMFQRRDDASQPLPWVVYGGTLLTVLAAGAPGLLPAEWTRSLFLGRLGWLAIGLAAGLLLAIIGELWRYDKSGSATLNLARSTFAIVYIGGLMGFLVQLRLFSGGAADPLNHWGMLALLSLVATVKMSDIGQYTTGRNFGRHKLAPIVSPGKTWEGAAGGLLFAVVAAWFVFGWVARHMFTSTETVPDTAASQTSLLAVAFFALVVAAAGIVGDLAESMLKRDADVKDSSSWLPGFGGVLDLLDSLLGAAPVVYLLWALGIVGPH